ncbi:hypothetical protein Mapa_011289 [Marchantia paleacea]|nr:hypothetical protein Mapa_011289 [Marchantia paleacea]
MALRPLPLDSCIGFAGMVPCSLLLSPDKSVLIYPLGTTIVLRNRVRTQPFSLSV